MRCRWRVIASVQNLGIWVCLTAEGIFRRRMLRIRPFQSLDVVWSERDVSDNELQSLTMSPHPCFRVKVELLAHESD